jgi:hypothetical protein
MFDVMHEIMHLACLKIKLCVFFYAQILVLGTLLFPCMNYLLVSKPVCIFMIVAGLRQVIPIKNPNSKWGILPCCGDSDGVWPALSKLSEWISLIITNRGGRE